MVWQAILGQVLGNAGKGAEAAPIEVSQQPIQESMEYKPHALTIPREQRRRSAVEVADNSTGMENSIREGMRYY